MSAAYDLRSLRRVAAAALATCISNNKGGQLEGYYNDDINSCEENCTLWHPQQRTVAITNQQVEQLRELTGIQPPLTSHPAPSPALAIHHAYDTWPRHDCASTTGCKQKTQDAPRVSCSNAITRGAGGAGSTAVCVLGTGSSGTGRGASSSQGTTRGLSQ